MARVLCDPVSQVSFVTNRLANCLQLYRQKCDVRVEGVGATINTRVKFSVTFTLRSTTTSCEMRTDDLVLSSITSPTPAVKIDINQWPYLRDIDLADNRFSTPGTIDVLIGADVWGRLIKGEVIGGGPDEPFAQCTRF